MKTEVYTWRLSAELKAELERAARREGSSVATLLEQITRDWLRQHVDTDADAEQRRIRAAAAPFIGSLAGDDPTRSERVRELVRERLARKHAR